MSAIEFTIIGICYSLKNTRVPITYRGRVIFVPNNEAKKFERAFKKQLPPECATNIEDPVHVDMEIFYPSNRQDLDPALVLDCMQRYGVIKNDRQVISLYCAKRIDPENPRVIVKVEPVHWERSGKQVSLLDDEAERPEVSHAV